MRIIAGQHRGRQLVSPGNATRPITDRAKQSIFDVLNPSIEGSIVYDIFSGTGSMGLECLSRGAELAWFFEADRTALTGLKKNIAVLKVEAACRVFAGDLFKLLPTTTPPRRADLIFLDPPYRYLIEKPEPLQKLTEILRQNHAHSETILLFRHDTKDQLTLNGWTTKSIKTYGSMTIEMMGDPAQHTETK